MEAGLPLLKFLFPQIPSISYAAAQHSFGFSPTSSKWDLRTALTVHVLRQMMSGRGKQETPPIGRVQKRTLIDPGVKGQTWVATEAIPPPPSSDESDGQGLRDAAFKAIDDMKEGEITYIKPALCDIEVEWTGFRSEAAKDEPLPKISEGDKYKRLMQDPSRTSNTTILYFHGGAYYLCDPATHRQVTSKLAKACSGRVCSVRYRLAPQTAFPGQLLDALQVYLSLLYPPQGSMHNAVPAENIVFGGDSAGGNLSFALLQLLLHLHRSHSGVPTIHFHGRDVHVPLPAGASACSGWFDISRSMPSITGNQAYDYLPPAQHDAPPRYPEEADFWPSVPPRGDLFCDLSLLDHPLVSPLLAPDWRTSCPLWLSAGQETLADECAQIAALAAQQDVSVTWQQYEAMPHVFQMLLPFLPTAKRCVESWGAWAKACCEGRQSGTSGVWVRAKQSGKDSEREVDVKGMQTVGLEEARRLVRDAKSRRMKAFEGAKGAKATL